MNTSGIMFRPMSLTLEDNEKVMRTSEYFVESGFREKYEHNLAINQIIAESAKIFIVNNYQKVTDWSGLDVTISTGKGKRVHYYSRTAPKNMQNPVKTFTDVVLDPTDGDFSVTINGTPHLWLFQDEVITIADFIEKAINPKP